MKLPQQVLLVYLKCIHCNKSIVAGYKMLLASVTNSTTLEFGTFHTHICTYVLLCLPQAIQVGYHTHIQRFRHKINAKYLTNVCSVYKSVMRNLISLAAGRCSYVYNMHTDWQRVTWVHSLLHFSRASIMSGNSRLLTDRHLIKKYFIWYVPHPEWGILLT